MPYITNQWQNYQKELEIKTDLVGRISESFVALLVVRENMEIDLEDNRIPNNKANVFKNQFRDWSISSAVIGSQLIAYFPHGEISQEWNSFVNLTDEFYSITAPGQKQRYPNIK